MVERSSKQGVVVLASLLCVGGLLALWQPSCNTRRIEMSANQAVNWEDEKIGSGVEVREGSLVRVRYWLAMPDGSRVVDLYAQDKTHPFRVGDGTVITGLDEAVRGMRQGGIRTVKLPPIAHYGRKGYGGVIPEDTELTMRLELIEVGF